MNPKRPLIFVPGIRTSRLAIKKDGGGMEDFWPLMPHEFLMKDKLDRVFQYLDTKIRLNADDDVQVVATSLVPFAYDGLIKSILAWGYKPNIDFWIFPYDWRQSNRVSGRLLAKFIEEKIGSRGESVDIVSHSMGGIITRVAHKQGAPIRRAAYVACPHLGSPLAYFVLHPEIDSQRFIGGAYSQYAEAQWRPNETNYESLWRTNETPYGFPRKTLYQRRKDLFIKFPSIYELLPDESYLRDRPILFANDKPVHSICDTYLRDDWAFKEQDMQTNVIKAMEFKKELGLEIPVNADGDILLICGTDKPTCDTVGYKTYYHVSTNERRASYVMQRGFALPYASGQSGDGYVPVTSAMASISGRPAYQNSVFIPETHALLPNTKATIETIGRFLRA